MVNYHYYSISTSLRHLLTGIFKPVSIRSRRTIISFVAILTAIEPLNTYSPMASKENFRKFLAIRKSITDYIDSMTFAVSIAAVSVLSVSIKISWNGFTSERSRRRCRDRNILGIRNSRDREQWWKEERHRRWVELRIRGEKRHYVENSVRFSSPLFVFIIVGVFAVGFCV